MTDISEITIEQFHSLFDKAGVPVFDSIVAEPSRFEARLQALINGHAHKAKEADDNEVNDLRLFRQAVTRRMSSISKLYDVDALTALDKLLADDLKVRLSNLSRELTDTKVLLEEAQEKADKYDQLRRLLDIPLSPF